MIPFGMFSVGLKQISRGEQAKSTQKVMGSSSESTFQPFVRQKAEESMNRQIAQSRTRSVQYSLVSGGFLLFAIFLFSHTDSTAERWLKVETDQTFIHFSLDAMRRPHLCGRLDSMTAAPRAYGVHYDTLHRPVTIYRLFFGNIDSRSPWSIMRFEYDSTEGGGLIVTRTWHAPNGTPVKIGVAHGERVLYDSTGTVRAIAYLNADRDRVDRVNAVTAQLFRRDEKGGLLQEWRYSNNKQFNGAEPDFWNTQATPVSDDAYFRTMHLNADGFIVEEHPLSLALKPIPYPNGVEVVSTTRDHCGNPTSIEFRTISGEAMADRDGLFRTVFEYNDRHQLLRWYTFGIDLEPLALPNGAASGVREYREFDGKLLGETLFDPRGKPLPESE